MKTLGVTGIKLQIALMFDDGTVVGMGTPVFRKDIRHGDYFPDDQIAELLRECANELAQLIEDKTALAMRQEVKATTDAETRPLYWKKPDPNTGFSAN